MPNKGSAVGAGGMLGLGRRQSQVERTLYKAGEWSLGGTKSPNVVGWAACRKGLGGRSGEVCRDQSKLGSRD